MIKADTTDSKNFKKDSQSFELELQQSFIFKKQKETRLIPKKIKKKIIAVLTFSFVLYAMLWKSYLEPGQCIRDYTHQITALLNAKVNQKGDFCYYFLIFGQLFIDIQLIFFAVYLLFKVQNLYSVACIGIFYGVRAIFLNIEKFPYPLGIYWEQPGFPPSIGVPYGITRDFFYSGHTGLMFFSCMYWGLKEQTKVLHYISQFGLFYVILVVITTRVHYIVDVFAAIFYSLFINKLVWDYLMYFDYGFTKIVNFIICLLKYLAKWKQAILLNKKQQKRAQSQIQIEMENYKGANSIK